MPLAALPKKAQTLITTTHIDWMEQEFSIIKMPDLKTAKDAER